MRSIQPGLDLGRGLSIEAYAATISNLQTKLAAYNTALSTLDKLTDDVNVAEQTVMEMSEKMLMGVGGHFGKASQEYEMAGGSRRRNRRRSTSTPASVATSPAGSTQASTNGASPATVA